MIRLITVFLVIGGIVLSSSSKLIVSIFAAPDFYDAWRYIPLLTIAAIFQCISSLVGGVFMASKNSKYFFYSSIWAAVVSLVCTFFFIKIWGLVGVCIALTLSFLCMLVSRAIYATKYVNVEYKPLVSLFLIAFIQIIVLTFDVPLIINIIVSTFVLLLVVIQNMSLLKSVKQQINRKG